jgi:putative flippase GtrA
MSSETLAPPSASLKRQIPAFVAVGAFGFVVDASVTVALNKFLGVDPYLARFPAFAVATVLNFCLNRWLTFSHSTAALADAFVRYVMVCAVGLAVNYAAYACALAIWAVLRLPQSPAILPLFVAFGSGVAMFVTYFGFRRFAFRV